MDRYDADTYEGDLREDIGVTLRSMYIGQTVTLLPPEDGDTDIEVVMTGDDEWAVDDVRVSGFENAVEHILNIYR